MKKQKFMVLLAGLLLTGTANAEGLFGAGLKPKPNLTLFGQKVVWPIPSLCVGGKAGVLPDANVSADGISFKIPWFAVDLPFPTLTLSLGKDKPKVELKLGEVNKNKEAE